jgi:8-oxo-dGTP pyrophosphatase MutT (NUDIX family)
VTDEPNPWVTHTSDIVYDNAWIEVTHRAVTTPTGTDGIYGVVHFKNLAIAVVPIDDHDHTWLVGQYRYAIDQYSWEIPEGGGQLDEDPADAARRELREECGLDAAHLDLLFSCELSNSVSDERARIYIATGLTAVPADPDDTEVLELRRLPVDEAIAMAMSGEITDALSLMALLRLSVDRA